MTAIHFSANFEHISTPGNAQVLGFLLPNEASLKLPSRGMTVVNGVINGVKFQVPLEPNGQGSHWFLIDKAQVQQFGLSENTKAEVEIKLTKDWPEPEVPSDLLKALKADPEALAKWEDITTMARWDWIRWMDAVVKIETRKERPQKLCSMLRSGKRRPCCFNRAYRSNPRVATLL